MIKIGVVSDTHMPGRCKKLPEELLQKLSGVNMIIHAGDLCRDYVIYELEELAPVYAVLGNNDDEYLEKILPLKRILEVEECRIGIFHGHGYGGTASENAREAFKDQNVDCVVFGHSHAPLNLRENGILYFNPGSATDKRRQPKYTFGIITVDKKHIAGEIIELVYIK